MDVSNVPLISRDYNYFLFVGSVKPHKNLKNALLAFRQLKKDNMIFLHMVMETPRSPITEKTLWRKDSLMISQTTRLSHA